MRACITGSAPTDPHVLDCMKAFLCIPIIECFGMTETLGGLMSDALLPNSQHIGGPTILSKIKLRDLPELNYRITDHPPRGEIMIFSQSVTKGYFKLPDKTAEDLENGWMKTGDVGIILENGSIKVIDRVKSLFKLSHGGFIAPEKLENIFL